MPGIYAAMEIARKALFVNQTAIQVTSHNISNANTPGFSRQQAVIEEANAISSTPGQMGMGSIVSAIQRISDPFIESQLVAENGTLASLNYTASAMGQIESIFNDSSGASLADRVNEFYNAWDDLSANPQGMAERQTVVSTAELLTSEFRRVDQQLSTLQRNANADIKANVDDINQLAQQIAKLNESIKIALAQGQNPNDLQDERGLLLKKLAEKINYTTFTDDQGRVSIFVGKGRALVDGELTGALVAEEDPSTTNLFYNVKIRLPGQTGGNLESVAGDITGGELASAIRFRDGYVGEVKTRVDKLAYAIGAQINAQHFVGYGLDGATGNDFFTPLNDIVGAARNIDVAAGVSGNIRTVAAAGATNASGTLIFTGIPANGTTVTLGGQTYTFLAGAGPPAAGNFNVDTSATALASLGLGGVTAAAVARTLALAAAANKGAQPFTVTARGGVAMITADAPGTAGNAIVLGKASDAAGAINVSGATLGNGVAMPAPPPPAGDNRNSVVMANLRNATSAILGNATVSVYIAGDLVGRVGSETKGVDLDLQHQKVIVNYLETRREEVAGVSIDEEMTNLIKFQRAFEAATKMITLIDQLLNDILNLRQGTG